METVTVVVAPAPVAVTQQPPQHKLAELKPSSFAGVPKSSPATKAKPAKTKKLAGGCGGYVLEDVPHLTDYLPELKVIN
jgi:6-phosphofructokinase 1